MSLIIVIFWLYCFFLFFFSSRRRQTSRALVTGFQTCALPICCSTIVDPDSGAGRHMAAAPRRSRRIRVPHVRAASPVVSSNTQQVPRHMPEVIINGPEGRLEGRYHHNPTPGAPIAVLLHPHPLHGGTMNNRVVLNMFHAFTRRGFSVLRFNFRGVGRSQGRFARGEGELA